MNGIRLDFYILKYETKAEEHCISVFLKSSSSGFLNTIQKWLFDLYSFQFISLTHVSTAVAEILLYFFSTGMNFIVEYFGFVSTVYFFVNLDFVET